MSTPVYEIRSLKHGYGGKPVLEIEDLAIEAASIVGLIGPNGSGKSTFLKLLGFIERPADGEIRFKGRPAEPFSGHVRFSITMLPQEPFLMKRSVFNNVSYGLRLRGDIPDTAARVHDALAAVGLDSRDFARRPWYALSGGEAQRVALAARLVLRPEVLLLDEPTASVDAASAQLIKDASIRARNDLGTTLIIASHDWQWLYEICDHVLHLFKGRIFGTGRETIIFGPWRELARGVWGKTLSDGQRLRVPAPPEPGSTAVVEDLSIDEKGPLDAGDAVVLEGTVSRLSLERQTGRVFATVLAGDLPLTVRLRDAQRRERSLFPGNAVHVRYHVDRIRWM